MHRLPLILLAIAACKTTSSPIVPTGDNGGDLSLAARPSRAHKAIPRPDFNRWAVRLNLPLYWVADADGDGDLDPSEVASLLFYPTRGDWVRDDRFTAAFEDAYDRVAAAAAAPVTAPTSQDGTRRALVGKDLDAGRATLVATDLSKLGPADRRFVGHMMRVAELVDDLYEHQNGAKALAAKLPPDPESRSLFRRNRGPKCVAPLTENEPLCSAIPGSPRPVVDLYPSALQQRDKFCKLLEQHKDAKALMSPFTVVRGDGDQLSAVPYHQEYKEPYAAIASELTAAADVVKDPGEQALVTYLRAAAASFGTNDWGPADEAWAKMTVDNSRWYVRIAPDEVYWEPCASKAGLHLSFARINQGSRAWQQKLVPVQQEMERVIAQAAGAPYKARDVTFHLPDFIDIVVNAGDDRDPLGATIGQSLPNWGAVANEGRGRTVAMVNLYGDPDSLAARRMQAESVLDAASMTNYTGTSEPGLLSTILHEATHNLGPAHEYKVKGKKARDVFGGPMATMLEELKAQTGALFLLETLRERGVITAELANQSYVDAIVWALGHVSQGMYTATGERKTYSNVAAVQIGYLLDKGALSWDDAATAANGQDRGALIIHADKLVPAVATMMKVVGGIKARGDRRAAEALAKRYVDGKVVPHATIKERFLRVPKASFVYAVR